MLRLYKFDSTPLLWVFGTAIAVNDRQEDSMTDQGLTQRLLTWYLVNLLDHFLSEVEIAEHSAPASKGKLSQPSPVHGFLTRYWFGPFLLGPGAVRFSGDVKNREQKVSPKGSNVNP